MLKRTKFWNIRSFLVILLQQNTIIGSNFVWKAFRLLLVCRKFSSKIRVYNHVEGKKLMTLKNTVNKRNDSAF